MRTREPYFHSNDELPPRRQPPRRQQPRPQQASRQVTRHRPNRKRRRFPWLRWLLAAVCVAAVVFALRDPRFNVRRIEVQGARVLTPAQVLRASGLTAGRNLFRTRLKPARKRLLSLPAVASVSLHRRLPPRVIIRVTERQPMACVAAQNGHFTIDSEGVVFRADATPPRDLPLVTGLESKLLHPGGRLASPTLRTLNACLGAARSSTAQKLTRIHIDQNANLCFNMTGMACEVRLGPPEQLSEKFSLLTALEHSLPDLQRDCEYIDISCPDAPAWKPRLVSLAKSGTPDAAVSPGAAEGTSNGHGFAQD